MCGGQWMKAEEKMTDVNIAVEMLQDAHLDAFDDAIIVSADGDLVPVVKAIRSTFTEKRVLAAFPPNRFSDDLKQHVNAAFHITPSKLKRCLLPPRIKKQDGFELLCPKDYWHPSFGPKP